jgi:SAM-dependent methyltransferase
LVALTNFYGATALAMFYPILVWAIWVAYRERAVLLRAIAIPVLAYALTAFWLTPSYFRITLYNLRYVSQPGNRYSVLLTIVAALVFGTISLRKASRKPELIYAVFAAGSLLFFALNVLGYYYFNFRVLGEPHRLVPELDMAMILAGVEFLRRLWIRPFSSPDAARIARGLVLAVALFTAWTTRHFIAHAWDTYPKEPDYQKRVEYRMSDWIANHMPDSRTYVAGSVRFWWDAWHDNAEVGGGSDQGLINPNPNAGSWEIILGSDPERAVRWLQSLGADAVIVSDANSREIYHDFRLPYKFTGTLPVLFDDGEGNVIYSVPRRYRSIARVVDTSTSRTARPVQPATDLALLTAYSDMVEKGPDSPALTKWNGTDSLSIHASLKEGESLLAQVTYDPSWRAYSNGRELPIRADAMDFMAIDAPAGVSNIELVFEMPLENRIGYAVSGLGLLICLGLCVMQWKAEPVEEPEPTAPVRQGNWPLHLRILARFLRSLHHHLPPWPGDQEPEPFDQQKLDRAASELRKMSMPDAGGDAYLEKHLGRLSRTLALVPPPQATGRVLELGCYMQITPLLQRVCGYREVRGAYYGPPGKIDRKTYDFPDGQFECYVDHFDVERDSFPYPDGYFDLVVAGEIIEHMTYDPMWMLLEARRVLADGGYLLLTTPNVGSVASFAKALYGRDNPQIFFVYERPAPGKPAEIGHVREYTTYELGEAAKAAGFEIEALFTTFIEEFASHRVLLNFLAVNGYETKNRGEQSWCLARKRASLPTDRFPSFIYIP